MPKLRFVSGVLLILWTTLSENAVAEKFTCSFTEPWITVTYDTANGIVLSQTSPDPKKVVLDRRISVRVTNKPSLVWEDSKGRNIAQLELTGRGGDGMSDTVYPYDITMDLMGVHSVGGCYTTLLKPTVPK